MSPRFLIYAAGLLLGASAAHAAHQNAVGITALRAKLLAHGWSPLETFGADPGGRRWNQFADAGSMYQAGMIEVESCSGTGLNFCTFYYRKGKQCFRVVTQGEFKQGEYEPHVMETKKVCPSTDSAQPAKK